MFSFIYWVWRDVSPAPSIAALQFSIAFRRFEGIRHK